jgi:hypothetical protein
MLRARLVLVVMVAVLCVTQQHGLQSGGSTQNCFKRLLEAGKEIPVIESASTSSRVLEGFAERYNDQLILSDGELLACVLKWSVTEPVVSSLSMAKVPDVLLNADTRVWLPAVLHRAMQLNECHWTDMALVRAAVTICHRLVRQQGPSTSASEEASASSSSAPEMVIGNDSEAAIVGQLPFDFSRRYVVVRSFHFIDYPLQHPTSRHV